MDGRLWNKFERELGKTPISRWEFVAPRSGFPHRRGDIYKLFLRPSGTRRKWWYFEDEIMQVPSDYPSTSYRDSDPFDIFRGSANVLEFVGVDDQYGGKEALKRVLKLAKPHLLARNPLQRDKP